MLAHFQRRWSSKGSEGCGFLSPIGTFEKIKCIFSIAPIRNLEKSRECFLTEKHSPDAGLRVRCA